MASLKIVDSFDYYAAGYIESITKISKVIRANRSKGDCGIVIKETFLFLLKLLKVNQDHFCINKLHKSANALYNEYIMASTPTLQGVKSKSIRLKNIYLNTWYNH